MIHEWEENKAKGKRGEQKVWESGDGGGEQLKEKTKEIIGMREKEE